MNPLRLRLPAWALLVPLVYAPAFAIGDRPSAAAYLAIAGAVALAAASVFLAARTQVIEHAADVLSALAPIALLLMIVAYVVASAWIAHDALERFSPEMSQLGLYTQSVWTSLHGYAMANTHETIDGSLASHFGVHFSPTLLLYVPLYAVWRSPMALIVTQAFILALAILPLFALLKRDAGPAAALTLCVAYLLVPVFALAGIHDVHDATFLPLFLLTTLWAMETRRWAIAACAALLALGVREDTGFALALMGAYLALSGRGWKPGLTLAALGIAWLVVVVRWVMPQYASPGLWIDPQRFFAMHMGQWGHTPGEAVRTMLTHPVDVVRSLANGGNARYLYALLQPLLVFPAFGDLAWIMGAPAVLVNLLSAKGFLKQTVEYYAIVPMLFGFLAAARTAARVAVRQPSARRHAPSLAAACIVLAGVLPAFPLTNPQLPRSGPPAENARRALAAIPRDAPVYAPVSLYPALASRKFAACWESVGDRIFDARDRSRYTWIVVWPEGDETGARDARLARVLETDPRYVRAGGDGALLVYRRR